MEQIELIKRNIEEILTIEELKELLESKRSPSVYCGYEVSGPVHIGHLINMRKLLDLQRAGFKVKILLADYHTWLNLKGNMEWIEQMIEYWKRNFIAVGLSPKKAEFVVGSSFQRTQEYFDDLLKLSLDITINRALRSMQNIARNIENAHVSQIIYPLMQILDIKYLGLDAALGGMEQRKIHVLAREVLPNVGWKTPVCLHNELLISLQGSQYKMSSSRPETLIILHESPQLIKDKISKAFCPPKEVKDNPILQISKLLLFPEFNTIEIKREKKYGSNVTFSSYQHLENAYKGGQIHPQDLKNAVADYLIKLLEPIRKYFDRYQQYLEPLKMKPK